MYYPNNPFSYSGPYALEISNVDLEDAAGHALSLYATSNYSRPGVNPVDNPLVATPQWVNDVWIHGSAIRYSAVTGLLVGANFARYEYSYCDEYSGFKDDPALFAPRNIKIENNEFSYNNTGPMGGGAVRYVGIRNNNFLVNYIMPQNNNFGGGGLDFEQCSDKIDISNNIIIGPSSWTVNGSAVTGLNYPPFRQTSALELYGRNINISGNTLSGHGETGIGAWSLFYDPASPDHEKITNNHILKDNGWSGPSGGIEIGNSFATGPCISIPRDTRGVKVSANDSAIPQNIPVDSRGNQLINPAASSTQAYGVFLRDHGGASTSRLFDVSVADDNFLGSNSLYFTNSKVFLDSLVGLYGYSGATYTSSLLSSGGLIVLPVSVHSASSDISFSTQITPTPPLCSDLLDTGVLPPGYKMGSRRAKFRFSAKDAGSSSLNGASNIAAIWGAFSILGDDSTGAPGPTAVAITSSPQLPDQGICNFLYVAETNLIYLGNVAATAYNAQSAVGAGGQDLATPGGCIIHGASSTAGVSPLTYGSGANTQLATPVEYVLDLVLDVTLPDAPLPNTLQAAPTWANLPGYKYHIYSFTETKDQRYNPCTLRPDGTCTPFWQYSGYWWNTNSDFWWNLH